MEVRKKRRKSLRRSKRMRRRVEKGKVQEEEKLRERG